jgi:hypothetical protein
VAALGASTLPVHVVWGLTHLVRKERAQSCSIHTVHLSGNNTYSQYVEAHKRTAVQSTTIVALESGANASLENKAARRSSQSAIDQPDAQVLM